MNVKLEDKTFKQPLVRHAERLEERERNTPAFPEYRKQKWCRRGGWWIFTPDRRWQRAATAALFKAVVTWDFCLGKYNLCGLTQNNPTENQTLFLLDFTLYVDVKQTSGLSERFLYFQGNICLLVWGSKVPQSPSSQVHILWLTDYSFHFFKFGGLD